jgi:hypothetical protein
VPDATRRTAKGRKKKLRLFWDSIFFAAALRSAAAALQNARCPLGIYR